MLGSPTATHLALDIAEAAINEAKTESAAGILAPGDRAFHGSISADPLPVTTAQVKPEIYTLLQTPVLAKP